MQSELKVKFNARDEFVLPLEHVPQMDSHAARQWLDGEFTRMECEPIRGSGKVLNADKVVRVAQVCERFELSERSLQRLTRRRIGLSPKMLIQRRRLHEASARLRDHPTSLADVAADLGYADQPHFTRDFRTVTGMTPGEFAARYAPPE